jgi:hypothetical protein
MQSIQRVTRFSETCQALSKVVSKNTPLFMSSDVHFEYLTKKKPPEILDFKRL